MLVSVLTPSFNQAAWLRDNLQSVANQTYPHIEHVVMDGGSTDGSIDILRQSSPSVRWRSEHDRGQSHALNKAFDESNGEIIGWLNSDDAYVDRRAVELAVETFRAHPEVGVVYGHALLVNRSNRVIQYLWAFPFHPRLLDVITPFVQPAVFIRRSVITPPLVDESLHYVMDRDLWLRLRDRTSFKRINCVVALDRHQPARKTLQEGYPIEARSYDVTYGRDRYRSAKRVLRRGLTVAGRFRALPYMVLGTQAEPAIPLCTGSRTDRARYQVLTPRHRMPLD